MKVLIVSSLLVVAITASLLEEHGPKFQTFKLKHGKTYLNQAEEAKRFNIFMDNVRAIEEHNVLYEQGKVSYKKGINQFTDMTQEEFEAMLANSASQKPTLEGTPYVSSTDDDYPASVDWREDGQVTEIKNQGLCLSCWAFTIAGSTEAAYKRKSGKLISLSQQQMVDCTTDFNFGCNGGYLDKTLPYVQKYGLQAESDYPYTAEVDSCKYNESNVVTKITDYSIIRDNEESLLSAVANIGPVSVSLDSRYLSAYDSGIFADPRCSVAGIDHGVLIIGYGTENGKDFWLVKNTWGVNWGEKGFFRIARGNNECGIAHDCVFPIIL